MFVGVNGIVCSRVVRCSGGWWWYPRILGDQAAERVVESFLFVLGVVVKDREWFGCWRVD